MPGTQGTVPSSDFDSIAIVAPVDLLDFARYAAQVRSRSNCCLAAIPLPGSSRRQPSLPRARAAPGGSAAGLRDGHGRACVHSRRSRAGDRLFFLHPLGRGAARGRGGRRRGEHAGLCFFSSSELEQILF